MDARASDVVAVGTRVEGKAMLSRNREHPREVWVYSELIATGYFLMIE
jgi:hypothetical protein